MPTDGSQELMPTTDSILSDLPAIPAEMLDLSNAIELPITELSSLGVALYSLPEALKATASTTTSVSGGELLYRVTDVRGNVLTPDRLHSFNNGSGYLGSIKVPGTFAQAKLNPVQSQTVTETVTSASSFNPTMLFVAAALTEINQKLDEISDLQQEMFAYAKQRDHAKLVAAFKDLDELKDNYRFNSTNDSYISTRHRRVLSARSEAEHAIEFQRERLAGMLKPLGAIHMGKDVSKRTASMVEALRDYQLASYLYCYSTLMDVMLVGNYDSPYLESIGTKMEKYSLEYFELYTRCANRIEEDAKGSIGAVVAGGIGAAGGKLGRMIAATPVGDKTQIDEALIGQAHKLGGIAQDGADKRMAALAHAKPGFMRPFIDSIEELDRLHNEPVVLAMGKDSLYVLPLGEG